MQNCHHQFRTNNKILLANKYIDVNIKDKWGKMIADSFKERWIIILKKNLIEIMKLKIPENNAYRLKIN